MHEENNGAPKNKWSRIFRKKWFFPALYLALAAILLSAVVWYQALDSPADEARDEQPTEEQTPAGYDKDAEPVMEQQEVIQPPVENMDDAEIVTKYYDYSAEQEEQEDAIIVFNDRYYQSTGIDVAGEDGETFDVMASLGGTVQDVQEDPLMGNVVTLTHANGVTTHYASLGDVEVSADDEVEQGDVIGNAGENLFGKNNGTHLHFEIRKDGEDVNPEEFFNQPLSALDEALEEEKADNEADNDQDESEETGEEADIGPPMDMPDDEDSDADGDSDEDTTDKDDTMDNEDTTEDDDTTDGNDAANDENTTDNDNATEQDDEDT